MKTRTILRLISFIMLIAAIAFILYALSSPTLGTTIHIGNLVFAAEQWQFCYNIYILVIIGSFAASFFIKDKK